LYLPFVQKVPEKIPQWTTVLADGFEGAFPGPWQLWKSGPYDWGKRSCRAATGGNSAWAVGGGGLACGSNYPNNSVSWMYFGPFSLSDATAADLKFKLWANTQKSADFFMTLASVDDNDYFGYYGSGISNGWIDQSFDLTNWPQLGNLVGQPQVWIAFAFETDASVVSPEGAYVDDVVLRKCVGGACTGAAAATQSLNNWFEISPAAVTRPR
jgi:hypothetical protein